MPGESSSETENPYSRMPVTREPLRATIPVQNGARLSWDRWIAKDRNGFRRMKEERQIYKTLPQIFNFAWGLSYDL